MPYKFNLDRYRLEFQWTLAWFPVQSNVWLDRPRMRAGVIRHSSDEDALNSAGLGGGVAIIHLLGQQLSAAEEPLAPNNVVTAFATVRLTHDGFFEIECDLHMPGSKQHQRFIATPDERVPFMLTAMPNSQNETTSQTRAVFHGVAATGSRASTSILSAGVKP